MNLEDKNMNEIRVRKPSGIIYYPATYLIKLITKLIYKLKVDKKEIKGLKPPFLVIGNHASVVDIAFTASALLPHRLNILTSKDLFSWKLFKPFITRLGCIPKNQFSVDIMSLKIMKAAVEQGRNVILYPEGKTSIDGKELHYITPSIGKLVKFLNVPVVLSHASGTYLIKPRYFKGFRYGKVKLKQSMLFTQEEVNKMSVKEIYGRISEGLKFNDNVYQIENKIRFRSKRPALGLEYILYRCPKCGEDYKMRSTDRHLICDYCGNNVEYTEYGELIPDKYSKAFDRIDLWYDYQRECVDEEIRKDDFYICNEVDFFIDIDKRYVKAGEGKFYIDKEFVGYKGTKDGEDFEVKNPLKVMHTITTKNEEGIDLIFPEGQYRFLFKDGKGSTKYGIIVEQMFRMINKLDTESKPTEIKSK